MPAQQRGRVIGASQLIQVLGKGALSLTLSLLCWASSAQVSISSSGSPSYSHPIGVPPGISGMQPNLSLTYAGGGINGPVGHGWSVQGISMITRCSATRYTDGAPKGVAFAATDKLCLDGQRLIQTDASGAPSAFPQTNDALGLTSGWREYRTEKDSFARIRAYGVANGTDVNGPAYFKVWTKAGQIYEYGATLTADANTKAAVSPQAKTAIMVWAVARISDVVGNYIDFKYEQRDTAWGSGPTASSPTLGREWNVVEIQYTGNSSNAQVPVNKIILRYADRTLDRAEAYQQGAKNVSIRLLQGIDTYVNSPNNTALGAAALAVKVRSVNLTYDNGAVTKRSRLTQIKECAGASTTNCLPPVTLTYANGGNEAFTANASFNLTTTALMNNTGTMGVIPIDFDSDGKTDLLRWSDTASQNQLWKSNGDGTFTQVAAFNVTADSLFKSDRCFSSQAADFNGDGIPDLLRLMRTSSSTGASCGTLSHKLFVGSGSGSFIAVAVPGIDFSQFDSVKLDRYNCISPPSSGYIPNCLEPGTVYQGSSRTEGRNYYVLDLNGDGYLDVVTTILPAYSWSNPPPTDQSLCASTVCTRVYLGSAMGAFSPFASTNVANATLYSRAPTSTPAFNTNILPSVVDVDGDGLMDLAVDKGSYLSKGDGNFAFDPASTQTGQTCVNPVDFNGDGRADCLFTSFGLALQSLRASDGTNTGKFVADFNLKSSGQELSGTGVGYQTVDLSGDGRTDILRWKDDATQNAVYLSNGDGTFTASTTFNLTAATTHQLGKSDGTTSFMLGDFLGSGSVQILRLKHNPTAGAATANQLYVRSDPTLPDHLVSVISPTGLKTTLTYATLANAPAGRYASDRGVSGLAAAYPLVDLTLASPIVITSEADVGVGLVNKVKTEYAYKGLKAAVDGRGMLGFRQSVQQNTAANGEALSVFSDYLLDEPYAGVARRSETRKGAWNAPTAQLLSTTTNTYCDRTSATNPDLATDVTPCATSAKVRRPYLRKSVESGSDLGGQPLPTVTTVNTYNDFGDPTQIVVTTEATFAGANRQYIKSTVNVQCAPDSAGCPNKIAGDHWILGRLTQATVTNTVPNLLSTLTAGPGDAPNAAAIAGTMPIQPALVLSSCGSTSPTTSPTAATMSCTLSNTGQMAASSISYATAANTTVSGPTGSCASGATCGTVTVTTATGAATYSGTLTATPNAGTSGSQAISLVVNTASTPPALSLSSCSSTTPTTTPTAATMSCTLSNTGQTAASSISYTTAASTTVSGPTGACAAGATCGAVTVTTATTAGTYGGTLTATPNAGTAASQAISLVVNASPALLSASPGSVTLPTTNKGLLSAIQTVTVSNTGGSSATITRALTYTGGSSLSGSFVIGGTCTSASTVAVGGTCTVTVRWAADCTGGSRTANVTLSGSGFSTLSIGLIGSTSSSGMCN